MQSYEELWKWVWIWCCATRLNDKEITVKEWQKVMKESFLSSGILCVRLFFQAVPWLWMFSLLLEICRSNQYKSSVCSEENLILKAHNGEHHEVTWEETEGACRQPVWFFSSEMLLILFFWEGAWLMEHRSWINVRSDSVLTLVALSRKYFLFI